MPLQPQNISDWFQSEVITNDPALRAYLKKKVPQGTEVDDVMQETYAKILSIKRSKSILSARGLLFTIAKNILRDVFRKNYASKVISLGEIDEINVIDSEKETFEETARSDEIEMLQDAIRRLPKKCRIIFLLRNYERKTYKQIADELGISVKTVEAQLAIAIRKCRLSFETKGLLMSKPH